MRNKRKERQECYLILQLYRLDLLKCEYKSEDMKLWCATNTTRAWNNCPLREDAPTSEPERQQERGRERLYCVIQEVERKRKNQNGYPKELKSEYMRMSIQGQDESHYWHTYSSERFERDIKKAYRITIHESYRENGKVKKKQFGICTVDYYDLATDWFCLYDWGGSKIEAATKELNCSEEEIYTLIEKKLEPIQERIIEEFRQTEEYKTHEEHERITTLYAANKAQFNAKYNVSGDEYDKCYDVFGVLQKPEYLKKIEADYEARQRYEKESRRYYEEYYNNYNQGSSSSYGGSISNTYKEEDKAVLKQFYRELSKKFHPDANPDRDTSQQMQLLNQLKSEWGL